MHRSRTRRGLIKDIRRADDRRCVIAELLYRTGGIRVFYPRCTLRAKRHRNRITWYARDDIVRLSTCLTSRSNYSVTERGGERDRERSNNTSDLHLVPNRERCVSSILVEYNSYANSTSIYVALTLTQSIYDKLINEYNINLSCEIFHSIRNDTSCPNI